MIGWRLAAGGWRLAAGALIALSLLAGSASPVFAAGSASGPGPNPRPSHEGMALPSVNPEHPFSVVTIGEGADQQTITTRLVAGGSAAGGVQPMDGLNCSAGSPGYCTCITTDSQGLSFWGASVTLQTSWNFDYSTVWTNIGQGKSSSADWPNHWENFDLWTSGAGTPYAYSDLTANLMSGIGWASVEDGSIHMWHQIDAWGNCTPYANWHTG